MPKGPLAKKSSRYSSIHPRSPQAQYGSSQTLNEPHQAPGSAGSGVFFFLFIRVALTQGLVGVRLLVPAEGRNSLSADVAAG